MKNIIIYFLIFLAVCSLASCDRFSGDLSRDQAKSKLEKYSRTITRTILKSVGTKIDYSPSRGEPLGTRVDFDHRYEESVKEYNSLNENGYISITETSNATRYEVDYTWHLKIEEKLKPYIVENNNTILNTMNVEYIEVKIADVIFEQITGITKAPIGENARIVEYTTIVKPNPLSQALLLKKEEMQPEKREAIFIKYDDGWRLERW